LLRDGTLTNSVYYINSNLYTSGTVVGPCTLTFVADSPTAANSTPFFGVGTSGNVTATVTFARPRFGLWDGTFPLPYVVNTSSGASPSEYHGPRFDYDPTSIGTPRGLLIEGSANNLLTYSEDYSQAVWTKVTVDRTTGQASPDGGTGATLLSENAITYAKHDIERTQSISAGVHTFSVWVKEPSSNSRRYVCLQLADGQATAARYTIVADLQTGQITASGSVNGTAGAPTNTAHSITPYPGGWYRLTITMNCVLSPCYPVVLLSDISSLFGGNNQPFYSATTPYKGLIVWGAQLEAGNGASSYIPTGASTGNRAADNCYADSISSWYTQGSGTMLFFGRPTVPSTRTMLNFSVGTNVPRIQMYGSTSTDVTCYLENPSGTGANIVFPSGTLVNGTAFKSAWAFETGNHAACINAGTVATASTSSPAVPSSGITRLNIGMRYDGFNQFNGHVISAKYWPTRLANATLQAITTL
jgi:hypothetical protein